ncbi:MAG: RNA methyltransferase [Flavobacteriales bacterium]|nr:RNA methyltransferase [Flavobacteriales bacterium]
MNFLTHLTQQQKEGLLPFLLEFVSEERKAHFDSIIPQRTRHLTVVLEDIYQSQNASAVLRTCESLGVQDIHIIEDKHEYTLNPKVTIGCAKWLHLHKYTKPEATTKSCLTELKQKGYQIVATTPHKNDVSIAELDVSRPIALMLGTEKHGLTDTALEMADAYVKIPMFGFSESFNISVSAAICIQQIMDKLRNSKIEWQLSSNERLELELEWCYNTIKRPDLLVENFLASGN